MQSCMAGKDQRSFRDSAEVPLGISDAATEAEEKVNEKLAVSQRERSNEGD